MEYWLGSGLELFSAWSIEAVCHDSSVLRIREEPSSITWELLKSIEWFADQACLAMLEPLALPWSQRLSFDIILFYLQICDVRSAELRKRKPLVETVENLTFMLAQHLTAVKDVIFFWPITKEDRIYNLLTGKGGSVLRCSQINLLRRERRGAGVCHVYKLSK